MKSVLIDASSAILLYKAGLFDSVAGAYRLRAAPAVIREITVLNRRGASAFARACETGALLPADTGSCPDAGGLTSLGDGERETLLAYRAGQGDFVLIDDGRGAAACRSGGIPHINALLCPKLLHWTGVIDQCACRAVFSRLLQIGRYSEQVIHFAGTCTPEMLSEFFPIDFQPKKMQVGTRSIEIHSLNN